MKGFSLSIEIIVVIFIAIVVLIALLGFFAGIWGPGTNAISLEQAKTAACTKLLNQGCSPSTASVFTDDFDSDKNGKIEKGTGQGACGSDSGDNLYMLCKCYYDKTTDTNTECKALCGCT